MPTVHIWHVCPYNDYIFFSISVSSFCFCCIAYVCLLFWLCFNSKNILSLLIKWSCLIASLLYLCEECNNNEHKLTEIREWTRMRIHNAKRVYRLEQYESNTCILYFDWWCVQAIIVLLHRPIVLLLTVHASASRTTNTKHMYYTHCNAWSILM